MYSVVPTRSCSTKQRRTAMIFIALERFLNAQPRPFLIILSAGLVLLIAGVDLWTGRDVGVSLFYLLPIALVTWQFSGRAGYATCFMCAGAWLAVDTFEGLGSGSPIVPLWNSGIRLGFFIVTAFLMITLKKRLLHEQQLAHTDSLTALYNARAFRQHTQELISLSRRYTHPMALVYIDLDNFKQVNDQLGHEQGDAVLRMVGATLKTYMRASDIVARMGGDEFAIAMPETGAPAAQSAIAKIHHELVKHCALKQWPVGFSIGVAVFATAPASLDEAISFADRLMYRVKNSGKNEVLLEEYAPPKEVPQEAVISEIATS